MFLAAALMISIGLFPAFYLNAMERPVNLFTHDTVFNLNLLQVGAIDSLKLINLLSIGFIIVICAVLLLRKRTNRHREINIHSTWGCGYVAPGRKLQYTAGSFVRSYTKLAKPVLEIEKKDVEIRSVFPGHQQYESETYDKIEKVLIDRPIRFFERFSDTFTFLQNGNLQFYILYGIIFIMGVICLPLIFDRVMTIIHFLNNL
jgi:hypothetical protein